MTRHLPRLFIAGLAASSLACASFAPRTAAEDSHLYTFRTGQKGLYGSVWYLTTPSAVILFDAPLDGPDVQALLQEVRVNSTAPVEEIFVTSASPIAYAGVGQLSALSGGQVFSSSLTSAVIESDGQARLRELAELVPVVVPPVVLESQLTLDEERSFWSGGLRVIAMPVEAGTGGAGLVVWIPRQETLIAGALAFDGVHPWVTGGGSEEWITTLEQLSERLPIGRVLPGFGAAGGPELIQGSILYLRTLQAEVERHSPAGRALGPELEGEIYGAMVGSYSGWKLEELLTLSIRDEWQRQGGTLAPSPAPAQDAPAGPDPQGAAAPPEAAERPSLEAPAPAAP